MIFDEKMEKKHAVRVKNEGKRPIWALLPPFTFKI
jgi:hypothetical protein